MLNVEVSDGKLEGELVLNEFGGRIYSFKGIPYAQPPLGDLRFQAPRPVKPWSGVRSAKQFGPTCYQFNKLSKDPPSGSEDCLYLNVYTPSITPSAPLPVMVFIHGGGLSWGSGNDDMYGPEFLVRHRVILVTFNYRLEALGFLCLNTKDVPGNAGMKDQVAALRWVKNNISKFGGDPENVTIFGESAGAGCVGFHLVSPITKGLFKRAICQSGGPACWWALTPNPRERAQTLAKQLGCYSNDDKELNVFFKNAPLKSLVNVNLTRKSYDINLGIVDEIQFGDEERYFYGDIFNSLRNEIHEGVEILAGYNEDDGNIGLAVALSGPVSESIIKANKNLDYFVPNPMLPNTTVEQQEELVGTIKKHFLLQTVSRNNLYKLVNFFTMEIFGHGVILFGKMVANTNKNKIYIYNLKCKTNRNLFGTIYGLSDYIKNKVMTSHGDDLLYLFPTKFLSRRIDQKSMKAIDTFTELWTNFAKYGNPTPDRSLNVNWLPYSAENQDYLEIGNELKAKKKPNEANVKFWENLYDKYFPGYGS